MQLFTCEAEYRPNTEEADDTDNDARWRFSHCFQEMRLKRAREKLSQRKCEKLHRNVPEVRKFFFRREISNW